MHLPNVMFVWGGLSSLATHASPRGHSLPRVKISVFRGRICHFLTFFLFFLYIYLWTYGLYNISFDTHDSIKNNPPKIKITSFDTWINPGVYCLWATKPQLWVTKNGQIIGVKPMLTQWVKCITKPASISM